MSLNIYKKDVLVVNRAWFPLGTTTIKQALTQLGSENNGNDAGMAFDIQYEHLGEDRYNFDNIISINPVPLEIWITLPVRAYDSVIHTCKMAIRIPTVVLAINCNTTHLRKIKLSSKNILERDNYTCQYSGIKLPRSKLNVDHIISKDEWQKRGLPGSPNQWTNMVASDKEINRKKSNKSNHEAGLKLIRQPKEPLACPAANLIREIRKIEWGIFLFK